VTRAVGAELARPVVGRGAAYADFDGDGDLDIVVSVSGGPAVLLRNDGGNANGWLRIRLVGTKSNRDGIGARVRLLGPGIAAARVVRSAASYASQSETILTFGLGPQGAGDRPPVDVEVDWPDGSKQVFKSLAADRLHVLAERP